MAHGFERTLHDAEPVIEVVTKQFEVGARRPTADAEPQPVCRQGLYRLHAVRKLDRISQWELQDRNP